MTAAAATLKALGRSSESSKQRGHWLACSAAMHVARSEKSSSLVDQRKTLSSLKQKKSEDPIPECPLI